MSLCNVLAVLGDREDEMWKTFDAAVALADAENARLTLAKTCDEGRAYVWITPFAFGGVYVPPPLDSPAEAAQRLAKVAERVPDTIPVTMQVLGGDTQASLVELLRAGNYGAIVAEQDVLRHCRRLRRQLRRDEIRVVPVSLSPAGQDADGVAEAPFTSNAYTEDGLPDAFQVSTRHRRRWNGGLRPWHTRRLAGAGSKQ